MVSPALADSVLSAMKARLGGWLAKGRLSVDDVRDLITFLDAQLEPWVREDGR